MKKEELFSAMTDIDDRFIEEAAPKDTINKKTDKQTEAQQGKEAPRSSKKRIYRFSTLAAACLVLLIGIGIGGRLGILSPDNSANKTEEMAVQTPNGGAEAGAENDAADNAAPQLTQQYEASAPEEIAEDAALEEAVEEETETETETETEKKKTE